ncbi:carbonic anhydrase 3-like [Bombyx mandarina]|uniref:Carbonic anhydrase 3-like n=1 Tax=Bombyx mandarina TaxID=7092 RepID=A0A6J2KSX6_BOMMA|nr:carbonic anhydrase 3-like [Bombyx mandarina]
MCDRIGSLCWLMYVAYISTSSSTELTHDQTTSRANTLFDDADDIQKQLEIEAKNRFVYGSPKAIWVFHLPPKFPEGPAVTRQLSYNYLSKPDAITQRAMFNADATYDWEYAEQNNWWKKYPQCGGRSQSPVDIPVKGLIKARRGRPLLFCNYDVSPENMTLIKDGRRVTLTGFWDPKHRPLLHGGAAHSHRYVFYSLSLHWPSEHTIGNLQYPLESQALHISAEYNTLDEAVAASRRDPLAMLGIANLYKFANKTQKGLKILIEAASRVTLKRKGLPTKPLSYFNPPFKEYSCYHGSLTAPPCTEAVLWFVRAKALPVQREAVESIRQILISDEKRKSYSRQPQPLNDRKVYFFN